jgi:hypothetical protein
MFADTKVEALASYAKMAEDDSVRVMAYHIQARAVCRMGELLKQFDDRWRPAENSVVTHTNLSQRQVAEQAGISKHQQTQAVRVANVPEEEIRVRRRGVEARHRCRAGRAAWRLFSLPAISSPPTRNTHGRWLRRGAWATLPEILRQRSIGFFSPGVLLSVTARSVREPGAGH